MRPFPAALLLILVSALAPQSLNAQSVPDFDMAAYKAFLAAHPEMTSDQLLSLHPAGSFQKEAPTQFSTALHFPMIDSMYQLTADEKTLLGKHGFVVTERVSAITFAQAFLQIYNADLPLFVSTDAILHALHMSYDLILERVEEMVMIPKLGDVLNGIHAQLPALASRYTQEQGMGPSLSDLDLYLTVARRLLGHVVTPFYPSTMSASDDILLKISAAQWTKGAMPLFADSIRLVDYSQFTVRGHYTHSEMLGKYFQSMMWLGRTEFYLSPPKGTAEQYTDAQIQRQTIAAMLVMEAVELAGMAGKLGEIDDVLRFFVGESDNVTLACLKGLNAELGVVRADELLDLPRFKSFQTALLQKGWAYQRILSQMLCSGGILATDQIQPASSFLLMGQRFVIDSYVTGRSVASGIYVSMMRTEGSLQTKKMVLIR